MRPGAIPQTPVGDAHDALQLRRPLGGSAKALQLGGHGLAALLRAGADPPQGPVALHRRSSADEDPVGESALGGVPLVLAPLAVGRLLSDGLPREPDGRQPGQRERDDSRSDERGSGGGRPEAKRHGRESPGRAGGGGAARCHA